LGQNNSSAIKLTIDLHTDNWRTHVLHLTCL